MKSVAPSRWLTSSSPLQDLAAGGPASSLAPRSSAPPAAGDRSAARSVAAPARRLAPVAELLRGARLRSQPRPLPGGVVRVLDRELGEPRLARRAERPVELPELAGQDAHRPAVGDDVVQRQHEQRGLRRRGAAASRAAAAPRQVEGPARLLAAPGASAPPRPARRAGPPAPASQADRSARTTWTPAVPPSANVVRSDSWRRTSS